MNDKYKEQFFKEKKLISIVLCSRERLELTKQLIHSIETKTKNLDLINVTALIDFDDYDSIDYFSKYGNNTSIDFKLIIRQRTHKLIKGGINLCYKICEPAYFYWPLNNDTKIITENWDEILFEKTVNVLKEFNGDKKYLYIHIDDDTHVPYYHTRKGNCFPICSTTIGNIFNGCVPEEILHWGYDSRLHGIINWVVKHPDIGHTMMILDLIKDIKIQHTTYYIRNKPTTSTPLGTSTINTTEHAEGKRLRDDIDLRIHDFTNELGKFDEEGYHTGKYFELFMLDNDKAILHSYFLKRLETLEKNGALFECSSWL